KPLSLSRFRHPLSHNHPDARQEVANRCVLSAELTDQVPADTDIVVGLAELQEKTLQHGRPFARGGPTIVQSDSRGAKLAPPMFSATSRSRRCHWASVVGQQNRISERRRRAWFKYASNCRTPTSSSETSRPSKRTSKLLPWTT